MTRKQGEEIDYLTKSVIITNYKKGVFFMGENKQFINNTEIKTIIGNCAFMNREDLTYVVLPDGIKSIGDEAFAKCKNLKSITLPANLEQIGASAFSGCKNLEKIILSPNIKRLSNKTFEGCRKLKRIVIPEGVEELDSGVFAECTNLEEVVLPESLKIIGKQLFLNCKNLKTIIIPSQIEQLPEECFMGCTHLTTITSAKKLMIGKRCFRNCKSLIEVPSCVANYSERAFENCTGITSINIIDSNIPNACFRGCKNLKQIDNQENIYSMGAYAFSGCDALEAFDIYNLISIPSEAFSNCKNLKKVRLGTGVKTVGIRAFFKCSNLVEFNLPDTIETIKKEAFRECNSIVSITIPANLKCLGEAAFAFMGSLQCINVSPYNKTFITPDHKILISDMQQRIVLYASGLKDKSYSLKEYNVQYDELGRGLIRPLTIIGEFAFAGAKELEELTICSCIQDIEATAFYGCEKLKRLRVDSISLFSCPGFHTRDKGRYYTHNFSKHKVFMPFEEVSFEGDPVTIFPNALENFTNVKSLSFPTDIPFNIASNAFSDCSLLEEVVIPNGVTSIDKNSFNPVTKLKFANGLELDNLVQLIHDNQYVGDYKLYVLKDGSFYIEEGETIVKLTKQQIDVVCSKPEEIRDNPVLFLDFMNDLIKHDLAIKPLFNGILMSLMSLENRKILFDSLKKDDDFFLSVIHNSQLLETKDSNTVELLKGSNFAKFIKYVELLRRYNITDPKLYHKFFIANLNVRDFKSLIQTDIELLKKIIIDSGLFESESTTLADEEKDEKANYYLTYQILQNNTLNNFMRLVKKYDIKDKYLFSKFFVATANNPLMEDMIKVYDANIRRLLKASHVADSNTAAIQNLSDLLVLMRITGALEEDPITRQRASTFINEKMFDEKLPNGKTNEYRIVGDDIHRIFNFPSTRDEFDQEFANFFFENYQELVKEERRKAGFIQRVYLNFRQISKTCTSNKGSQRKLKVTMDKCRNYLSNVKFDNVTEEKKEFAYLIGQWYDNNSVWENAQRIYNESLQAPRNIFTKVKVDKQGNIIYDTDPEHDLKEEIGSDFSYQWLPKQDYDNLILGKYCNCCAHIDGAGQGIMRASMILDCCQNLVIRNIFGEIIAKSTLYVNKEEGYAVFNNVESSFNYRDDSSMLKIYKAFLRGSKAFIERYNENNPDQPINNISIGANRNTILEFLTTQNNHPEVPVQRSLKFGEYSLNGSGYAGDWETKQRLVLGKGA